MDNPTRRQHYIPQYFFRNFAISGDSLNVFHFSNGMSNSIKIENIAKEDFFYGADTPAFEFEQGLSKFESMHSAIIKKIINSYSLNYLNKDDNTLLRVFTLFQESRTKSSKMFSIYFTKSQTANGKIDITIFKKIRRNEGREMGHPYRTAFGRIMQAPILSYESISDLKIALIINTTNNNFICGDAPTVRFNQLKIENERMESLFSPGLEIFYPINNEILLLFYDPNAYDIDFDYDSICYIDKQADLDALNKLQIINALDFVLFSDINQRENIENLSHEIRTIIDTNVKNTFGSFENSKRFFENFDDNYWKIFCWISKYDNYKLDLSFIHPNIEYKQYWLKKYYDSIKIGIKPELIRNKDLEERVRTKLEEASKDPRNYKIK